LYPKNTIPDAPFGALRVAAYTENALFTLPDASTIRKILANLTPPAHFTGFNSPGCDNPSGIDVASPLCSGPAPMTTEPPKPVTEIPLLAQVLGRVPSGVFILAIAGPDGQKTGLLASWVQQASFNPPQVTVAINKSRWFIDWLAPGPPLISEKVLNRAQTPLPESTVPPASADCRFCRLPWPRSKEPSPACWTPETT
jgi:hypothetical protein